MDNCFEKEWPENDEDKWMDTNWVATVVKHPEIFLKSYEDYWDYACKDAKQAYDE